jgi:hypothetical protein
MTLVDPQFAAIVRLLVEVRLRIAREVAAQQKEKAK